MARALKSISSRMVIAVLAIHAVLLPLLSFGMLTVVRHVQEDVFIDHVRIYVRVMADLLHAGGELANDATIMSALDSSILGGRCVYAVFQIDDRRLQSTLMGELGDEDFIEDFRFGDHGDDVYYLSAPMVIGSSMGTLQLGFDELPTLQEIESARLTIIRIVVIYLLITVLLVILLSTVISKPLRQLRHDSRHIASGDYSRQISSGSEIFEIHELTNDLEHMRSTLVGVNQKLEAEIASREAAEADRRKAEIHMRHMHRLQSIGTLAGGVAHEFNNVLLPMLLYTDLALEDLPDDSPVRPNLERVMRLANRAKGLSEQILMFGRPSGEAEEVVADIAPVIEEAMSMVRALVPANIEIQVQLESPSGPMVCNANELQQSVVNLCSNAFQSLAHSTGGIRVTVQNCHVDADFAARHPKLVVGDYVRVTVADDGEGMDSATIEQIFDPFFSTREAGKGTGLGLSVVHGIVTKHRGAIVVASKPDEGTTIDLYFPKSTASEEADYQEGPNNDKSAHN